MRYNVLQMDPSELEAYQRLQQVARGIDPSLTVDRGSVHRINGPYPGISFGLVLEESHALLFVSVADITEPGWEQRLPTRLESAHRYLLGFTHPAR